MFATRSPALLVAKRLFFLAQKLVELIQPEMLANNLLF